VAYDAALPAGVTTRRTGLRQAELDYGKPSWITAEPG
jgi:hypothetical protein